MLTRWDYRGKRLRRIFLTRALSGQLLSDGSQRFSPITCIFPVSRLDAGQGSARTVSVVLSLATVLLMSREVVHSGTC